MTMRRGRAGALACVALLAAAGPLTAQRAATAQAVDAETRTAQYFDEIRDDPVRTLIFLRDMPKGADLHSHLSGAIYAESYVVWAAEAGLCIDTVAGTLAEPPCSPEAGRPPAAAALTNPGVRDPFVDALSVRNWHRGARTAHAQFFGSFDRFRLVSHRTGDMLAEVAARAAAGGVSYLELMQTLDGNGAASIARQTGWDDDLGRMRERLLAGGLRDTLALAGRRIDESLARQREVLRCDAADADAGCAVTVRFLYQALRARAPELVFAHLLAGFELASTDPRVVGVNLVQPEDHPVALRDYSLHMRMIGQLRQWYPEVRVALHAGELAAGLVPPEDLRFHITEAVRVARADRVGHGVAIAFEDDADALLAELAERNVLVEIALGSNDFILGVRGREHPLALYLRAGVPVALVTDDEGVLRSEMTLEYLKAVQEHGLGYIALKTMARNSIAHAFVEADTKARLQRELEQAFERFEERQARRHARRD